MVTTEQIAWTREALEHVFDLVTLQHCLNTQSIPAPFHSARDLQQALLDQIQLLKPTLDVPASSLAWRVYNTLDYRYVRGLTQNEAAAELNISLRQLRREQDRGIEAVAALLFDNEHQHSNQMGRNAGALPAPPPAPASSSQQDGVPLPGQNEYLRLDDLMHAVLSLIDPLLSQNDLNARVTLPAPAPIVWTNRIVIRQLLIMAISWFIRGANHTVLDITGRLDDECVCLQLSKTSAPGTTMPSFSSEEQAILQQLAQDAGITLVLPNLPPIPGAEACAFRLLIPVSVRSRVLMIDDSVDSIELARRYLESTQFDLVAVTRAEDALLQAQTLQPSCILLDVMMPGRDGWEILALLKSHPDTICIPVIVSSVLRNHDLAYALGASAILARPYTATQLVDVLQSAIAQTRQHPAKRSV